MLGKPNTHRGGYIYLTWRSVQSLDGEEEDGVGKDVTIPRVAEVVVR